MSGICASLPFSSAGLLRTFVMRHVPVSRCRACELRTALRTVRFRRSARLLALVPKQIAEGRELSPVATVLPALWFWSLIYTFR